jgi:hypothetical protein
MTTYRTISIDGLDIFYREAGFRDNPTILVKEDIMLASSRK